MSCPSCRRDYELPRRYLLRADDMDFLPIPRLLSCLHTVCHSCLEEMRERSSLGKVMCPVCRQDEVIKGVKYLPLDVTTLQEVLKNSSAEVLSMCSRCYDDVPSYSWCASCSSALCEFHHQDHKLSVDTAKHDVLTFKEVAARNRTVEPRLPPPSCPDVLLQDCTAYCRTCAHVTSTAGTLQNHAGHQTESCQSLFQEKKDNVSNALYTAEGEANRLSTSVVAVREALRLLDSETDRAEVEIRAEMDALRRDVQAREDALFQRLATVSERKRSILRAQLSALSETIDACHHTSEVASALLSDTEDGQAQGHDRSAYLVAAAATIERQTNTLVERIKGLALEPLADSVIAVSFNLAELEAIRLNLPVVGSIQVTEEVGMDDAKDPELTMYHSKKARSKHLVQASAPAIAFSIKSEPPTSHEADSKGTRGVTSQSVVVEARSAVDAGGGRSGPGQGALLGQIIFTTETDRRLLAKQEQRSFFESVVVRNIPVMKIVRETLPISSSSSTASLHSSPSRQVFK